MTGIFKQQQVVGVFMCLEMDVVT